MKYDSEFRLYLTSVRKSRKTLKPYSPKVITDLLRRCRTVEALLSIDLSQATVGTTKGTDEICATIRQAKLASTPTTPYAHLSLINAVRIYADFLTWKKRA
jgi:hypothetical protein